MQAGIAAPEPPWAGRKSYRFKPVISTENLTRLLRRITKANPSCITCLIDGLVEPYKRPFRSVQSVAATYTPRRDRVLLIAQLMLLIGVGGALDPVADWLTRGLSRRCSTLGISIDRLTSSCSIRERRAAGDRMSNPVLRSGAERGRLS
jgi:hypothetical protein